MKLVVCIDGTWNEASTRTNVWKLKQDIDASRGSGVQATYIDGIGTVPGTELLGGMFAADFDRPLGLAFKTEPEDEHCRFDFSSLAKVHNEETPLDPIEERVYREGEKIDRSVRDRVKTQAGYFPSLSSLPTRLAGWLGRQLNA